MTFTADKPPWYEQAEQVDRFVTRFGQSAYRQLAYYAAFPLVLTPELVHYLRIEFLRDANVPWEAEVDLLLSDLCSQVGYELYTMDTQVRAYLLDQIKDDPVWQQRMANVAQVLLSYVNYLSRSDPKRRQKELDAQRLAAMTYLGDDGCRQAVEEITDRLQQLGDLAETGNSSDKDIRAEVAYLTRIAQEQALQLRGSAALVEFAQVVQRLLRNPESVSAEAVARSYRVGEVELCPGAFPLGKAGMRVPGLPPLKPLTFETGQFVPEGLTLPPLETQTVEVVTVEFAADSTIPSTELVTFAFDVATLERDFLRRNTWSVAWSVRKQQLQAQRYIERLGNSIFIAMVAIPGSSFVMGSPSDEPERLDREGPQHDVQVSDFLMGQYPVTQIQWRAVAAMPQQARELNPDPARFKSDNRPVERVSWYDAVEFCARLSAHTGREYRLPTEAEWEYACRARTTTPFSFGDMIAPEVANYNGGYAYNNGPKGENRGETTPVDHFKVANGFGLSDMHGNVLEWCEDHYHSSYKGAPTDGSAWIDEGAEENKSRVIRGGAWDDIPWYCRSASRYNFNPRESNNDLGFRVVCVAPRAL